MQDASQELSNAPRVSFLGGILAVVAAVGVLLVVGVALRSLGMGLETNLPPVSSVNRVSATLDAVDDAWKKAWVDLPIEAWREAGPVFAAGHFNSGLLPGERKIELLLEVGVNRYTVQATPDSAQPHFYIQNVDDGAESKRYIPLDPVKFNAAVAKLIELAKKIPPRARAIDRLNEISKKPHGAGTEPTSEAAAPAASADAAPAAAAPEAPAAAPTSPP